jgi:uncharacterized protein
MATKTGTTTQTAKQAPEGQIVHTEIVTQDPKALKTFLEKTFGWKFETVPMPQGGDYHMFTTPGGVAGGVLAPQPGQAIATTPYIGVDDIKATAKKVEKAGAKILMPPTEIPGMGWFFQFQVKGGPVLACWQGPQ